MTDAEKLSAMVPVRVTVAEKEKLKKIADEDGLTLSDWIRKKLMGSKPRFRKPTPDREVLLRLLAAYGKAGSNLNQIARQLNRKQDSQEFEMPLANINQLLSDMKSLTDTLRKALSDGRQR